MNGNETRPPGQDSTKVVAGLLIAMTFAMAGIGLYAFYYNSTLKVDPPAVTLPR